MKNKDQKSLEMLYESMNTPPIVLLKEEKKFCEAVAEEIVNQSEHFRIVKLAPTEPLETFLNNKRIFQILEKTIIVPEEFERARNQIYYRNGYVLFAEATLLKLYGSDKGKASEGSTFDFGNPKLHTIARIPFKDKEKWKSLLQPTLELFIVEYLKKISDVHYIQLQSFPYKDLLEFWKWREEKAKFEGLRKKLPELEGIFD